MRSVGADDPGQVVYRVVVHDRGGPLWLCYDKPTSDNPHEALRQWRADPHARHYTTRVLARPIAELITAAFDRTGQP